MATTTTAIMTSTATTIVTSRTGSSWAVLGSLAVFSLTAPREGGGGREGGRERGRGRERINNSV